MHPNELALLERILSQPTSPFREGHVTDTIRQELDSASVPYFQDPIGNILIGVSTENDYVSVIRKKTPEPVRVFIAHMDHPGFHGKRLNESKTHLDFIWHGGSPSQHLVGAKVWLADCKDWTGHGILKTVTMHSSGRAMISGTVELGNAPTETLPSAESIFGGFEFRSPHWTEGDLIYTKAADDLVGCFAITRLAINHWKKHQNQKKKNHSPPPFIGLLTRAEEVGFIGAIAHFDLGWLQKATRPIVCVSLETSRALPGAEIGKGPVVRLGDRYTVFDSGALRVLTEVAQKVLPEKHQRRVMDGGSCEATAATVFGFPCVGISVPLGNYHNQSFEGGPDSAPSNGPAPEFVHLQDIEGLSQLCEGILTPKLPWSNPWKNKMKEFKTSMREYLPLLRQKKEKKASR